VTTILVTMEPRQPFTIIYAPITPTHLRTIEAKYYALIRRTIEARLLHEPNMQTRNRKPLKRPVFFEATWKVRCSAGSRFLVFYDVDETQKMVAVLAIEITRSHRLLIGGEARRR
jgi:hypothetical protein